MDYDLIVIKTLERVSKNHYYIIRGEQDFNSQNEFIICAINDYYERHIRKKNDPYLETREKEDAFADRIVEKVERKVLSNLPALLGLYVVKNNHSEDREE